MTKLYHMTGQIFVTYIYDEPQLGILSERLILPMVLHAF